MADVNKTVDIQVKADMKLHILTRSPAASSSALLKMHVPSFPFFVKKRAKKHMLQHRNKTK